MQPRYDLPPIQSRSLYDSDAARSRFQPLRTRRDPNLARIRGGLYYREAPAIERLAGFGLIAFMALGIAII